MGLDTATAPLFVGDDYVVERNAFELEDASDPIAEAWLTLKESEFDPDSAAALQKHITPTPQTGVGEITEPGDSSGTMGLRFELTAAETAALDPYTCYVYDIQTKTVAGKIKTRESGKIQPRVQVTETS